MISIRLLALLKKVFFWLIIAMIALGVQSKLATSRPLSIVKADSTDQRKIPEGLTASDWDQIRQAIPFNLYQQAYLKASNIGPDDEFGSAVAISGDTIVVGAPEENLSPDVQRSGAAYVFVRDGS